MKFTKMHALGNDFVIINTMNQNISISNKFIKYISNRYYGIGFDQLLLLEYSNNNYIDFYYRIFNSDGSKAYQCVNGARCFASFVFLNKLTNKKNIVISTLKKKIYLKIINKNFISANIGVPKFLYNKSIIIKFNKINYDIIYIGNYHCVIQVEEINNINIDYLSKFIKKSIINNTLKVNIIFMQIIDINNIKIRAYEYGVGETKSCGSGSAAAVVIGINKKKLITPVKVHFNFGLLNISWNGTNNPIYISGPTSFVYEGILNI